MEDSQPLFLPELLRKLTARDVMTAKPLTVTLETKLSKVMEFVDERHIQHFPVVEDERFAGTRANTTSTTRCRPC